MKTKEEIAALHAVWSKDPITRELIRQLDASVVRTATEIGSMADKLTEPEMRIRAGKITTLQTIKQLITTTEVFVSKATEE